MKKFYKLTLINILIVVICFIIIEIISTILFKKEFVNFNNKILLYSENKVFENYNEFFLHKKNSEFQSTTFYFDKDKNKIVKEYEYTVTTNNVGLVQKKQVNKKDKIIFILGASETKGQGASPWFYNFENDMSGSKKNFANIGFIGTGPAQQIKIMKLIKSNFNLEIDKLIFIITSGELARNIWNFNSQQLRCLKNHLSCIGTENIYGYNFNLKKEKDFATKIYNLKKGKRIGLKPFFLSLKNKEYMQSVKEIAKNSYFIKKAYLTINASKSLINTGEHNFEAISKINTEYRNKVYILHLSSKGQTNKDKSLMIGKLIKDLKMEKNYFYCQLPPIQGFHKNDGHPNKLGYSILNECLKKLVRKI